MVQKIFPAFGSVSEHAHLHGLFPNLVLGNGVPSELASAP